MSDETQRKKIRHQPIRSELAIKVIPVVVVLMTGALWYFGVFHEALA